MSAQHSAFFIDGAFDFGGLEPRSVPVKYEGKNYVLREASEDAHVKYRNAVLRASKLNEKGNISSMDGMADSEPILVAACLFEQYTDAKGAQRERPMLVNQILQWPTRVVKPLYEKAKEMSDINQDETKDQLKKTIENARKKLEKLEAAEAGNESQGKETPASTETTSNSAES